MESVAIYLIKSCGLLFLFFIAYHFLLRKETFFTTNRWFLLAGLLSAAVLPFVVFTQIIWVEPSPVNYDWSSLSIRTVSEEDQTKEYIYLGVALTYVMITIGLLTKFGFDFYSLRKIFKGKTIERQADFKLIDTSENLAPFSFFNTIVYNSSLYSSSELQNILEHEKVHCDQNHTADVLIARLFCVIFWFNPFIWLYKKAILQNLEFIADSEATKKISDKKAYQFTLLKITTHENCVAITNHFYQSLIKKRIVMLNKNQSKKRNSWKYILILPALVTFVFLFQIETFAQEKKSEKITAESSKKNENSLDVYKINKNTTDEELKEKTNALNKNYGIKSVFSNIKRNSKNEITTISVNLKKGDEKTQEMEIKGTEAIKTFGIIISKNQNRILTIDFAENDIQLNKKSVLISPDEPLSTDSEIFINGAKVTQKDLDELNPNEIERMDVDKNQNQQEIRITTKEHSKILNENEIFIDGKKVDPIQLSRLDQNTIDRMDVNKNEKTIRILINKNEKERTEEIQVQNDEIQAMIDIEQAKKDEIQARKDKIQARKVEIEVKKDKIQARKDEIQARKDEIEAKKDEIEARKDKIQARKDEIQARKYEIQARKDRIQTNLNKD